MRVNSSEYYDSQSSSSISSRICWGRQDRESVQGASTSSETCVASRQKRRSARKIRGRPLKALSATLVSWRTRSGKQTLPEGKYLASNSILDRQTVKNILFLFVSSCINVFNPFAVTIRVLTVITWIFITRNGNLFKSPPTAKNTDIKGSKRTDTWPRIVHGRAGGWAGRDQAHEGRHRAASPEGKWMKCLWFFLS